MYPVQVTVDQSNPMLDRATQLGANAYTTGYATLAKALEEQRTRNLEKWKSFVPYFSNLQSQFLNLYPHIPAEEQKGIIDFIKRTTTGLTSTKAGTDRPEGLNTLLSLLEEALKRKTGQNPQNQGQGGQTNNQAGSSPQQSGQSQQGNP